MPVMEPMRNQATLTLCEFHAKANSHFHSSIELVLFRRILALVDCGESVISLGISLVCSELSAGDTLIESLTGNRS